MLFDPKTNDFYLKNNKLFDPNTMKWTLTRTMPEQLVELSYMEAVKKLQISINKIKVPIGVIGSNNPTSEQYQIAEELGKSIANLGLTVICGGRGGIMEAVCKGMSKNNGVSIGILPELDLKNANQFITIPLATGIGFARNMIIASASFCLIAIGGSFGTLSEIGFGLQFGKKIFTINCDLKINSTINCNTVEQIIENICRVVFALELPDVLKI